LEARAEGIAAPSHARDADTGFAEKRIIDGDGDGSLWRKLLDHGPADYREKGLGGKTMAGEETIVRGPIVELLPTGRQQTGDGVAAEAEQAAQREGLRAFGDTLLGEGRGALSPELAEGGEDAGRVFFRTEAGGWRRRRARRLLSSIDHSTVSPREKSRAWARAEGKLIYHCSLALRLMSWTLVGKPIVI
jgi:hypothetical protein